MLPTNPLEQQISSMPSEKPNLWCASTHPHNLVYKYYPVIHTTHTAAVHAYPAHTHPDSCCCYFCAAVDIRILGTQNPKDKKKKLLFDLPTSLFAINNCSCGSHSFSACLWWNPKNKHIHPHPPHSTHLTPYASESDALAPPSPIFTPCGYHALSPSLFTLHPLIKKDKFLNV